MVVTGQGSPYDFSKELCELVEPRSNTVLQILGTDIIIASDVILWSKSSNCGAHLGLYTDIKNLLLQ